MEKTENTLDDKLRQYYEMLFPEALQENEYIRLVAIRNTTDGTGGSFVRYVRRFDDYLAFIKRFRHDYDLFNQIATNRGGQYGTKANQWHRRVLFLDFDRKVNPGMKTAQDCTTWIHNKLPKLFVHCIVNSGNGFHVYICVPQTEDISDLVSVNRMIAEITGADMKAVMPTCSACR